MIGLICSLIGKNSRGCKKGRDNPIGSKQALDAMFVPTLFSRAREFGNVFVGRFSAKMGK